MTKALMTDLKSLLTERSLLLVRGSKKTRYLLLGRKVWPDHQDQPARKVLPDPQDPKVRLDCKDRPAPKACVERSARPDNLECPAHLECPAPRASVAR